MCKLCIERLTIEHAILIAVMTDIHNEETFGSGVMEPIATSEIGQDSLEDKLEIYEELSYILN